MVRVQTFFFVGACGAQPVVSADAEMRRGRHRARRAPDLVLVEYSRGARKAPQARYQRDGGRR